MKKPLVFEYSAGGTVFKSTSEGLFWLIIKPKGHERWQLPKGRIDAGESSKETAVREVREEGGVETKLLQKIDNQVYFFQMGETRIKKTVTFYLLEYVKNTIEGPDGIEIDEVKFVELTKALEMLTFDNDKDILKKAFDMVERFL